MYSIPLHSWYTHTHTLTHTFFCWYSLHWSDYFINIRFGDNIHFFSFFFFVKSLLFSIDEKGVVVFRETENKVNSFIQFHRQSQQNAVQLVVQYKKTIFNRKKTFCFHEFLSKFRCVRSILVVKYLNEFMWFVCHILCHHHHIVVFVLWMGNLCKFVQKFNWDLLNFHTNQLT